MKARGIFISTLLVIDTFLGAFCYGFNTSAVLVIDPKLPAVVPPAPTKAPGSEREIDELKDKAKKPTAAGTKVLPTPLPKGTAKGGTKSGAAAKSGSSNKSGASNKSAANTKSAASSKAGAKDKAAGKSASKTEGKASPNKASK